MSKSFVYDMIVDEVHVDVAFNYQKVENPNKYFSVIFAKVDNEYIRTEVRFLIGGRDATDAFIRKEQESISRMIETFYAIFRIPFPEKKELDLYDMRDYLYETGVVTVTTRKELKEGSIALNIVTNISQTLKEYPKRMKIDTNCGLTVEQEKYILSTI